VMTAEVAMKVGMAAGTFAISSAATTGTAW
jgi:hypothetical protein